MASTLAQFEKVDGLLDRLLRAGDFMECADPRGWIAISNRLFDACVEAGMSFDEPCHETWAADFVTKSLVSAQ